MDGTRTGDLRSALLALAAGLLLLRFVPQLPATSLLLACTLLGLILLPFRSYLIGLFLLGFSWACLSAQWALDDRLDPALDGRTLWLQGRVVDLPDVREGVVASTWPGHSRAGPSCQSCCVCRGTTGRRFALVRYGAWR